MALFQAFARRGWLAALGAAAFAAAPLAAHQRARYRGPLALTANARSRSCSARSTAVRGIRPQYTQPPKGSFSGIPSSSTSACPTIVAAALLSPNDGRSAKMRMRLASTM